MNIDNLKIRCSSLGKIMTNPRSKSETLSETCKDHLVELFIEHKYGRTKDIESKYLEKGTDMEDDAITLYSRITKTFYRKNKERLANDFISGEPDLFDGESIKHADLIIDTKCSWSLWTYWKARMEDVNKTYFNQLQGYMALTGAHEARLAYCLINTPDHLVETEKYYLAKKMGVIDELHDPEYIEACKEIDLNHKFDDIPLKERMFEVRIQRDNDAIKAIYDRVAECRTWMKQNLMTESDLTEQLEESVNSFTEPIPISEPNTELPKIKPLKALTVKSPKSILERLKEKQHV